EDEGFYCIDNLPSGLLEPLVQELRTAQMQRYADVAVGIDARSEASALRAFPQILERLRALTDVTVEVLFLQTALHTLLRRFSETRRRHPLSHAGRPLREAIEAERELLAPIAEQADLHVETTQLTLHELRALLRERLLADTPATGLSLLLQSFGFKNSVPADTDFVFDTRCLPNPHWEPSLRSQTGTDAAVASYLEAHPEVERMFASIRDFLEQWIPSFRAENRSYLTVSIGCTGGHHRSVYLAERLAHHFGEQFAGVSVRHRELQQSVRTASNASSMDT
ncbi:MAG: RNase adapter RapZ, partial [Proteobacteria bacterium SW_6_67_9]